MAPAYIRNLTNARKHTCYSLRFNSGTILLHPAGKMLKKKKKKIDVRSLSVAAPTLCNALPAILRNIDYILTIKS